MNIPRSFRAASTTCLVVGTLLLAGPAAAMGSAIPVDGAPAAVSSTAPTPAVQLPSFRVLDWLDGAVRIETTGAPGSSVRMADEQGAGVLEVVLPSTGATEGLVAVTADARNLLRGEVTLDGLTETFETEIDLRDGRQPTELAVTLVAGSRADNAPTPVESSEEGVRLVGITDGVATVDFPGTAGGSYVITDELGYRLASGTITGPTQTAEFAVPLGEQAAYTLTVFDAELVPSERAFTVDAPASVVQVDRQWVGGTTDSSTPTLTGRGIPYLVVELHAADGEVLGSTRVEEDGSWSVTLEELEPGRYAGGEAVMTYNAARAAAAFDFEVVAPGFVFEVTSPTVGGTLPAGVPVFTGTGTVGADIEIRGAWGDVVGTAEVGDDGTWVSTWTKPLLPARYVGGTVKQSVRGTVTASSTYDFTVVAAARAFAVTSPTVGGVLPAGVPVFTGTGNVGADIVIRGAWGDVVGTARVGTDGTWTSTWTKSLLPARYVGGKVTQSVSGAVTDTFTYDFTVQRDEHVFEVMSPKVGDTIHGVSPIFVGMGTPGADIEIRGAWGDVVATTTANEYGEWAAEWTKWLLPSRYAGGKVTQTVDGKVTATFIYDFTIVR